MPRIAIIGGGITGLTAAEVARAAGHDVTLVDADARAGGVMRSERVNGFLCETGPQAILSGRADTGALVAAAGLQERLIWARPSTRRRFVYVRGALRTLPTSPPALLKTDLVGAMAKLRLAREPFIGKGDPDGDESVLAFFERRFGAEAARTMGAPAVIGIYAGDAAQLSMRSALPQLWELEQKHGSVLRGAMAERGQGKPGEVGGPPRSFSFPDGLEELPRALASRLGDRRVVARAQAIEPAAGGYRVQLDVAPALEAEHVVVATPAPVAATLVAALAPGAAEALRAVPYAPLAVAALGFHAGGAERLGMDVDAYGFIAARGEGIGLLGCQYESSIFEGRAPAGAVLLRALMGGTFDPAIVDASDEAIAAAAIADLRRAAGLRAEPDFVTVWRHPAAIPQYDLKHQARARAVADALRARPGLHVVGQATTGVGLNDCIAAAASLVRSLA